MSKLKIIKKVLTVFIALILVLAGIFYIGLQSKLKTFSKEVSSIKINEIDISTVKDGIHTGKYFVNDHVGAVVEVNIEDREIKSINLIEHKHGRGKEAENITNSVIEYQSFNVDTISGATGSSIVILKAIENSLNN